MADVDNKLADENAALKAQLAALSAEKAMRVEQEAKARIDMARKNVITLVESYVTSEKITPAIRGQIEKLMKFSDDKAVVEINLDDLKLHLESFTAETYARKTGAKSDGKKQDDYSDASEEIVKRANALVVKSAGSVDFAAASVIVMREDAVLAKKYINENGRTVAAREVN